MLLMCFFSMNTIRLSGTPFSRRSRAMRRSSAGDVTGTECLTSTGKTYCHWHVNTIIAHHHFSSAARASRLDAAALVLLLMLFELFRV